MRTALALLACIGCSSHYIPRSPGRVAVMMEDGKPVYVRDGVTYEHGLLGNGLVHVVAGNPAAVAAATEYHDHIRDGVVEILLGTAAMLGGSTWAVANAATSSNPQPRDIAVPMALMLGGMVVMLVGAGTAAAAEPYRWDAINLFNDGAGMMPAAPPTLGPPGWSASTSVDAKASLHMR